MEDLFKSLCGWRAQLNPGHHCLRQSPISPILDEFRSIVCDHEICQQILVRSLKKAQRIIPDLNVPDLMEYYNPHKWSVLSCGKGLLSIFLPSCRRLILEEDNQKIEEQIRKQVTHGFSFGEDEPLKIQLGVSELSDHNSCETDVCSHVEEVRRQEKSQRGKNSLPVSHIISKLHKLAPCAEKMLEPGRFKYCCNQECFEDARDLFMTQGLSLVSNKLLLKSGSLKDCQRKVLKGSYLPLDMMLDIVSSFSGGFFKIESDGANNTVVLQPSLEELEPNFSNERSYLVSHLVRTGLKDFLNNLNFNIQSALKSTVRVLVVSHYLQKWEQMHLSTNPHLNIQSQLTVENISDSEALETVLNYFSLSPDEESVLRIIGTRGVSNLTDILNYLITCQHPLFYQIRGLSKYPLPSSECEGLTTSALTDMMRKYSELLKVHENLTLAELYLNQPHTLCSLKGSRLKAFIKDIEKKLPVSLKLCLRAYQRKEKSACLTNSMISETRAKLSLLESGLQEEVQETTDEVEHLCRLLKQTFKPGSDRDITDMFVLLDVLKTEEQLSEFPLISPIPSIPRLKSQLDKGEVSWPKLKNLALTQIRAALKQKLAKYMSCQPENITYSVSVGSIYMPKPLDEVVLLCNELCRIEGPMSEYRTLSMIPPKHTSNDLGKLYSEIQAFCYKMTALNVEPSTQLERSLSNCSKEIMKVCAMFATPTSSASSFKHCLNRIKGIYGEFVLCAGLGLPYLSETEKLSVRESLVLTLGSSVNTLPGVTDRKPDAIVLHDSTVDAWRERCVSSDVWEAMAETVNSSSRPISKLTIYEMSWSNDPFKVEMDKLSWQQCDELKTLGFDVEVISLRLSNDPSSWEPYLVKDVNFRTQQLMIKSEIHSLLYKVGSCISVQDAHVTTKALALASRGKTLMSGLRYPEDITEQELSNFYDDLRSNYSTIVNTPNTDELLPTTDEFVDTIKKIKKEANGPPEPSIQERFTQAGKITKEIFLLKKGERVLNLRKFLKKWSTVKLPEAPLDNLYELCVEESLICTHLGLLKWTKELVMDYSENMHMDDSKAGCVHPSFQGLCLAYICCLNQTRKTPSLKIHWDGLTPFVLSDNSTRQGIRYPDKLHAESAQTLMNRKLKALDILPDNYSSINSLLSMKDRDMKSTGPQGMSLKNARSLNILNKRILSVICTLYGLPFTVKQDATLEFKSRFCRVLSLRNIRRLCVGSSRLLSGQKERTYLTENNDVLFTKLMNNHKIKLFCEDNNVKNVLKLVELMAEGSKLYNDKGESIDELSLSAILLENYSDAKGRDATDSETLQLFLEHCHQKEGCSICDSIRSVRSLVRVDQCLATVGGPDSKEFEETANLLSTLLYRRFQILKSDFVFEDADVMKARRLSNTSLFSKEFTPLSSLDFETKCSIIKARHDRKEMINLMIDGDFEEAEGLSRSIGMTNSAFLELRKDVEQSTRSEVLFGESDLLGLQDFIRVMGEEINDDEVESQFNVPHLLDIENHLSDVEGLSISKKTVCDYVSQFKKLKLYKYLCFLSRLGSELMKTNLGGGKGGFKLINISNSIKLYCRMPKSDKEPILLRSVNGMEEGMLNVSCCIQYESLITKIMTLGLSHHLKCFPSDPIDISRITDFLGFCTIIGAHNSKRLDSLLQNLRYGVMGSIGEVMSLEKLPEKVSAPLISIEEVFVFNECMRTITGYSKTRQSLMSFEDTMQSAVSAKLPSQPVMGTDLESDNPKLLTQNIYLYHLIDVTLRNRPEADGKVFLKSFEQIPKLEELMGHTHTCNTCGLVYDKTREASRGCQTTCDTCFSVLCRHILTKLRGKCSHFSLDVTLAGCNLAADDFNMKASFNNLQDGLSKLCQTTSILQKKPLTFDIDNAKKAFIQKNTRKLRNSFPNLRECVKASAVFQNIDSEQLKARLEAVRKRQKVQNPLNVMEILDNPPEIKSRADIIKMNLTADRVMKMDNSVRKLDSSDLITQSVIKTQENLDKSVSIIMMAAKRDLETSASRAGNLTQLLKLFGKTNSTMRGIIKSQITERIETTTLPRELISRLYGALIKLFLVVQAKINLPLSLNVSDLTLMGEPLDVLRDPSLSMVQREFTVRRIVFEKAVKKLLGTMLGEHWHSVSLCFYKWLYLSKYPLTHSGTPFSQIHGSESCLLDPVPSICDVTLALLAEDNPEFLSNVTKSIKEPQPDYMWETTKVILELCSRHTEKVTQHGFDYCLMNDCVETILKNKPNYYKCAPKEQHGDHRDLGIGDIDGKLKMYFLESSAEEINKCFKGNHKESLVMKSRKLEATEDLQKHLTANLCRQKRDLSEEKCNCGDENYTHRFSSIGNSIDHSKWGPFHDALGALLGPIVYFSETCGRLTNLKALSMAQQSMKVMNVPPSVIELWVKRKLEGRSGPIFSISALDKILEQGNCYYTKSFDMIQGILHLTSSLLGVIHGIGSERLLQQCFPSHQISMSKLQGSDDEFSVITVISQTGCCKIIARACTQLYSEIKLLFNHIYSPKSSISFSCGELNSYFLILGVPSIPTIKWHTSQCQLLKVNTRKDYIANDFASMQTLLEMGAPLPVIMLTHSLNMCNLSNRTKVYGLKKYFEEMVNSCGHQHNFNRTPFCIAGTVDVSPSNLMCKDLFSLEVEQCSQEISDCDMTCQFKRMLLNTISVSDSLPSFLSKKQLVTSRIPTLMDSIFSLKPLRPANPATRKAHEKRNLIKNTFLHQESVSNIDLLQDLVTAKLPSQSYKTDTNRLLSSISSDGVISALANQNVCSHFRTMQLVRKSFFHTTEEGVQCGLIDKLKDMSNLQPKTTLEGYNSVIGTKRPGLFLQLRTLESSRIIGQERSNSNLWSRQKIESEHDESDTRTKSQSAAALSIGLTIKETMLEEIQSLYHIPESVKAEIFNIVPNLLMFPELVDNIKELCADPTLQKEKMTEFFNLLIAGVCQPSFLPHSIFICSAAPGSSVDPSSCIATNQLPGVILHHDTYRMTRPVMTDKESLEDCVEAASCAVALFYEENQFPKAYSRIASVLRSYKPPTKIANLRVDKQDQDILDLIKVLWGIRSPNWKSQDINSAAHVKLVSKSAKYKIWSVRIRGISHICQLSNDSGLVVVTEEENDTKVIEAVFSLKTEDEWETPRWLNQLSGSVISSVLPTCCNPPITKESFRSLRSRRIVLHNGVITVVSHAVKNLHLSSDDQLCFSSVGVEMNMAEVSLVETASFRSFPVRKEKNSFPDDTAAEEVSGVSLETLMDQLYTSETESTDSSSQSLDTGLKDILESIPIPRRALALKILQPQKLQKLNSSKKKCSISSHKEVRVSIAAEIKRLSVPLLLETPQLIQAPFSIGNIGRLTKLYNNVETREICIELMRVSGLSYAKRTLEHLEWSEPSEKTLQHMLQVSVDQEKERRNYHHYVSLMCGSTGIGGKIPANHIPWLNHDGTELEKVDKLHHLCVLLRHVNVSTCSWEQLLSAILKTCPNNDLLPIILESCKIIMSYFSPLVSLRKTDEDLISVREVKDMVSGLTTSLQMDCSHEKCPKLKEFEISRKNLKLLLKELKQHSLIIRMSSELSDSDD